MRSWLLDADSVAAFVGISSAFAAAAALAPLEHQLDVPALLLSLVFPILSLPSIRKQRPWEAAWINALAFVAVSQMQDYGFCRPFATAISSFATARSYDYALHYPHLEPRSRIYAGLIMKLDITQRKQVVRIADCFPVSLWRDMAWTGLVVAACCLGIRLCNQLETDDYPNSRNQLFLPIHWIDWIAMHVRCGLIGAAFGYGLHILKLFYQIYYAPFRFVHPKSVMNNPLAASSLAEFWNYRWNHLFHGFLKRCIYLPLTKHHQEKERCSHEIAVLTTFAFSGMFHVVLLMGADPNRGPIANALCMAFFMSQAVLIWIEQQLFGPPPKQRQSATTGPTTSLIQRLFVYFSLVATAPLLIEPALRV